MVCIPLTHEVLRQTEQVKAHVKWRAAKGVGPEPDISKLPARFQLFLDNVPEGLAPWVAGHATITLALYLCGGSERPKCMPMTTDTDEEAAAELIRRRMLAAMPTGGGSGGKGPGRRH